jgi:hypothetical protein
MYLTENFLRSFLDESKCLQKININLQSKTTGEDLVDLVHEMDEDELHHPYSRWSYSHEKQYPGNNISTYMGQHHAYFDHETHLEHARAGRSEIPFTKLLFMGGNEYEKCLQR